MLADGRRLWEHVAGSSREWGEDLVGERGLSALGAVVGATFPQEVAEARRCCRSTVLLLPGIGAQGGDACRRRAAFASRAGAARSSRRRARSSMRRRQTGGDWRTAAERGGRASRARGLDCLGRVVSRGHSARYAAPAALSARRDDRGAADPLRARRRRRARRRPRVKGPSRRVDGGDPRRGRRDERRTILPGQFYIVQSRGHVRLDLGEGRDPIEESRAEPGRQLERAPGRPEAPREVAFRPACAGSISSIGRRARCSRARPERRRPEPGCARVLRRQRIERRGARVAECDTRSCRSRASRS